MSQANIYKRIWQATVLAVALTVPLWVVFALGGQHNSTQVLAQSEPDTEDSIAPTMPGNPAAISRTAKTLHISWAASTDSGGSDLAGYEIYRGNTLIGSSSTTSIRDTGLSPGTSYGYRVLAYDGDDNTSNPSATVNIKTLKRADANGDDKVDAIDLNRLATNWNKTGMSFSQGDFNEDGKIDAIDLNIIATSWGQ